MCTKETADIFMEKFMEYTTVKDNSELKGCVSAQDAELTSIFYLKHQRTFMECLMRTRHHVWNREARSGQE